MFCRLAAVYVVSETSNVWYESTTYYYTKLFVFFQVTLGFRYAGYLISSDREMYAIRMGEELAG